ncbi:hypothetical protein QBC43DRAFT_380709 [Cladorrhinum sp. PSN259]|nr:hypothetical protein QBC43DRAFT_380709 [Cladorrhinum sp. PSN259]
MSESAVKAVSLSERSTIIFASGLSLMLALIFSYLWDFIATAAVLFRGNKRLRRHVGLLAVWNAGEPWGAFKHVSVIAFCVVVGGLIVGILIPASIQTGNAAPVKSSSLFYPVVVADNREAILDHLVFRVPPVMRALSSATVAEDTRLKTDHLVAITTSGPQSTPDRPREKSLSLSYGFRVTRADLGLQRFPDLVLETSRACTTDYSWLDRSESFDGNDWDVYRGWNYPGNESLIFLPLDQRGSPYAPLGTFVLPPQFKEQGQTSGNISYAILVTSGNHAFYKQGSDPWYATEARPPLQGEPNPTPYQIKRGRPALSCWEQRTWKYKKTTSTNFDALKQNTSPDLAEPLLRVLSIALEVPMIYSIGFFAPPGSALLCSVTSFSGVVDADGCSIEKDMKRLILASYVATRHIFTDATLFDADSIKGYPNVYDQKDAAKQTDWTRELVLRTTDVKTFRLKWIIVAVTILVVMALTRFVTVFLVRRFQSSSEILEEMEGLNVTQLLRNLYETKHTEHGDYWHCKCSFPKGEGPTVLHLNRCGHKDCQGHVTAEELQPPVQGTPDGGEIKKTKSVITEAPVDGEDQDLEKQAGQAKKE